MLADMAGLQNDDSLLAFAPRIRRAKSREVDTVSLPSSIVSEAKEIYSNLKGVAINGTN